MPRLFFMTATNASGKSSMAKHFLSKEKPEPLEFEEFKTALMKLEEQNLIIVGKYSSKGTSGGCDTIVKKAYTLAMLSTVWDWKEDILMEGYLIGTKVWLDELIAMNNDHNKCRQLIFVNLNTTLDTCFKRIEGRSGKKREELKGNGKNVVEKHKSVISLIKWMRENRPQWDMVTLDAESTPTANLCEQLINLR